MTETKQTEREQQIQLLVDGNLDEEKRMLLLQQIDEESPAAWRTVALGYVEADVLRSCFREMEDPSVPGNVIPLSNDAPKRHRSTTVLIAAAMMFVGVFLGAWLRPGGNLPETEDPPLAGTTPIETSESIPPSFQAIETLDLALRNRGIEPVISNAVYQAELPDGRRLLLPIQRLSFQP